MHFTASALDESRQVDTVDFDFEKAFDLVNHDILIRKLSMFDIPPYLVSITSSFLRNRTQFVSLLGNNSRPFQTSSGVSQGSTLGPLLFLLFINDLPKSINFAKALLYADDLKIFNTISSISDAVLMQKDINQILVWATLNKMKLNTNKCSVMRFGNCKLFYKYKIDNYEIECVNEIKYMGVILDSKLTFNNHIAYLLKIVPRILGSVIRMCSNFSSMKTFILLYNTFVLSRLEYAAVVWDPFYDAPSQKLEKIQKRFLSYLHFIVHGIYRSEHEY